MGASKVAASGAKRSTIGRRWAIGSVLSIAAIVGVAVQISAHAQERHGPGAWGMPGSGRMMFGGSPERVGRIVDSLLDGLGATDAQRIRIKQIATTAAADMKSQHEAERGLRERGLQLFTMPSVDANAAEALRQQMATQRDQQSKRMLQALLDVAQVLTPEQRAKIGERMVQRKAILQERLQREQRERPPKP